MSERRIIDWEHWRAIFIAGNDSLPELASRENAPSLIALRKKCCKEKWIEQRDKYQRTHADRSIRSVRKIAKRAIVAIDRDVEQVRKMLGDLEKVQRIADALLYKPMQRFATLNMDELSPRDLAAFIKLGWEIKARLIELDAARVDWESPNIKRMFSTDDEDEDENDDNDRS
jgi:hypothetical protein